MVAVLIEPLGLAVFALNFLEVTLYRGSSLPLAYGGWLFVELPSTHLCKDACLFARTLEASQGNIKRLVLF